MKTLKRNECAILHYFVKKQRFELIARMACDIKKEDCREIKPCINGSKEYSESMPWFGRKVNNWLSSTKPYHVVEFQLGLAEDAPRMTFLADFFKTGEQSWTPDQENPNFPPYGINLQERVNLVNEE